MSDVKYTLGGFSAGDYRAVERYLNEQAAAGWELVRAGNGRNRAKGRGRGGAGSGKRGKQ